jgi:Cu(I)/Ag(I) efflux system protein CusF
MKHLASLMTRRLVAACLAGAALFAQATEGEVKKLDLTQGKVTIKHGELKNLDMPAMTMVFRARPVTLLNGLAEGDAISFEADKIDGQYVVTAIKKH